MKTQDAHSEATREKIKGWYGNTLLTRLNNKVTDSIIVVMQRLHIDDLVGHLLEQEGWEHLNLPAIAEIEERVSIGPERFHLRRPGDLLHAEREPRGVLEEFKRSMGSLDFAAQYQQEPVPESGNLIKWQWFGFYDEPPMRLTADTIIVSWDTAMSARELADYSAGIVLQVRGESIYVLDVIRERLEYPELKRKVIEVHYRWKRLLSRYALLIEDKGSGMSLIQDLRREDIHPIAFKPEGDKTMRMNAQSACIEAGAVHLPRRAIWLEELRKELMAFPAGRHNDQVDALSQALAHAKDLESRRCFVGTIRGHY
jgi:predicted phage terminase large subunit-like protein